MKQFLSDTVILMLWTWVLAMVLAMAGCDQPDPSQTCDRGETMVAGRCHGNR